MWHLHDDIMHNTDLHEDVHIQMDLVQEGGGTPQPAAVAEPPVADHARLFAPVRRFADLLYRIHEEVPAIQRLRFVTSLPRPAFSPTPALRPLHPSMIGKGSVV